MSLYDAKNLRTAIVLHSKQFLQALAQCHRAPLTTSVAGLARCNRAPQLQALAKNSEAARCSAMGRGSQTSSVSSHSRRNTMCNQRDDYHVICRFRQMTNTINTDPHTEKHIKENALQLHRLTEKAVTSIPIAYVSPACRHTAACVPVSSLIRSFVG